MGELNKPQILTFSEESTDITLFDCRWVPCSTRFVVTGTHPKGIFYIVISSHCLSTYI